MRMLPLWRENNVPTVHLLTPSAIPADGVSNDFLGMLRHLRRRGIAARAYAGHVDPALHDFVRPLAEYERHVSKPDDMLIYHHSVGWPEGMTLFVRSRNRKVLRYHNITPARFFAPYSRIYADHCRRGARETDVLVSSAPELLLADSAFNVRELVDAGADQENCCTVPPFHGLAELHHAHADEDVAAELRERTTILFVGRLAPNKGHLHLIEAFAYYQRYINRRAQLVLVGTHDAALAGYREKVEEAIGRHRLQRAVRLTGTVAPGRMKAYYQNARVFVCASEHEGFCIPLVEAMYFRLPIVAVGCSAVSETIGDAGLAWETPKPMLLAESIRQLDEELDVRNSVIHRQWRRYQVCYSQAAIARRFDQAVLPLLAKGLQHA